MQITIKSFDQLTNVEVYEIIKLRTDVFVVEQQSIYSDCDNKDFGAFHLQIREEGELIAYLRILDRGVSYESYSIGRVIVHRKARKKGLGSIMLKHAVQFVKEHWEGDVITISAQAHLTDFYKEIGFVVESDPYMEDGIEHIQMSMTIK